MSSYLEKNVKCNCCGRTSELKILKGMYQSGSIGLDTNPHNSAVYDKVMMCPVCGYATTNFNELVGEVACTEVNSEEYQKIFKDLTLNEIYKKLILAARLSEVQEKYREAAYEYLMASWYQRDKKQNDRDELQGAIRNYEKYLEQNADVHSATILIDCLRMMGNFVEAQETAESLLGYIKDAYLEKIVKYEMKLIAECDAKAHLVGEVTV